MCCLALKILHSLMAGAVFHAVGDWISWTQPWTTGRKCPASTASRVADEPSYRYIKAPPDGGASHRITAWPERFHDSCECLPSAARIVHGNEAATKSTRELCVRIKVAGCARIAADPCISVVGRLGRPHPHRRSTERQPAAMALDLGGTHRDGEAQPAMWIARGTRVRRCFGSPGRL